MSICIGTPVNAGEELRSNFIRWFIISINGRLARLGLRSLGDTSWPDESQIAEIERTYKGAKLIAVVVEPAHNIKGEIWPEPGFHWEDDYRRMFQHEDEFIENHR